MSYSCLGDTLLYKNDGPCPHACFINMEERFIVGKYLAPCAINLQQYVAATYINKHHRSAASIWKAAVQKI